MRFPSTFSRRTPVELQLTPMIDCVFLLMIYFLVASSFTISEQMLPSQLSALAGGGTSTIDTPPPPEAGFEKIVVRILWQGTSPAGAVNDTPGGPLPGPQQPPAPCARINPEAPR